MPDWYPTIRAAKYLGVAPWDLERQSVAWQHWALIAEAAENEAQDALIKQARGGSD